MAVITPRLLALALSVLASTASAATHTHRSIELSRSIVRSEDLLRDAFGGLAFGDSLAAVSAALKEQCDELTTTVVEAPYLPLARNTQAHLIATGVFTVGIDEAAFTFADDKLVLVEARGGAIEGLFQALEEQPASRYGFEFCLKANVVASTERDTVWLLGPDALHPHLFLWENPDLPSVKGQPALGDGSAARPEILAFGAQRKDLMEGLKRASQITDLENIAAPWLPTNPKVQVQVNCFGVLYAGFPRKVEAVFGDDTLQLAWILTGKGEEDRLRKALTKAYGKPVFVSGMWEFFDEWRVGLRKDKPEVLMLADELVPTFREQALATKD